MSETYRVQRCRSHEVHSTPRGWETVFTGTEAEAVADYHWRREGNASGDLYRIVDGDGVQQAVLSATECGPTD